MSNGFRLITLLLLAFSVTARDVAADGKDDRLSNRPKVPGKLRLKLQERRPDPESKDQFKVVQRNVDWNVAETAVIICDMWNDIYCLSAKQRINVMVPTMNRVVSAARGHGVMIIHAPSNTMDLYADMPQRQRLQQAKAATPTTPIGKWCYLDPTKEPPMPIEMSDHCCCDDPVVGKRVRKYTRQHPGLDIAGFDGISDSGPEIYNFFEQEGIKNIAIMGVHTNMCVLGRPFGIRQQIKLGKNIVLVRDLTDAMYDPRQPPFVSHTRGTELVVEHIEKYWCPSILSDDLTKVVAGSAGPLTSFSHAPSEKN